MNLLPPSSEFTLKIVKMEAAASSETLVTIYKTTHHHILEDCNLNIHHQQNFGVRKCKVVVYGPVYSKNVVIHMLTQSQITDVSIFYFPTSYI
jgi:hypothetical protein